jgi:NADP-dependent alcohol dehydrogenase
MQVLAEWGPKLIAENSDEARENIMWAANQALNGLIGSGVPQDWSTHYIGHAITALYDVDHARTLSMVMGSVMRHKLKSKAPMLARYARRVWNINEKDDIKAAELGIAKTEDFFARMGCPIRTSGIKGVIVNPRDIVTHIERAGQLPLGENKDIAATDVLAILERAA